MADDPWQEMDDWLARQCEAVSAKTTAHVMEGKSIDASEFHRWWGQAQAYHRMRSFVHGARNVR